MLRNRARAAPAEAGGGTRASNYLCPQRLFRLFAHRGSPKVSAENAWVPRSTAGEVLARETDERAGAGERGRGDGASATRSEVGAGGAGGRRQAEEWEEWAARRLPGLLSSGRLLTRRRPAGHANKSARAPPRPAPGRPTPPRRPRHLGARARAPARPQDGQGRALQARREAWGERSVPRPARQGRALKPPTGAGGRQGGGAGGAWVAGVYRPHRSPSRNLLPRDGAEQISGDPQGSRGPAWRDRL